MPSAKMNHPGHEDGYGRFWPVVHILGMLSINTTSNQEKKALSIG